LGDTTTRDQDATALAASYRRVDDAAEAFMDAMETALPLHVALVEVRKALRKQFRTKHFSRGSKT
jgi:archaellum component FlaF (FlaF/FlaG flagellin family)